MPGLGDAYYFLSLIGTELKNASAGNWRSKAELYDSPALRRGDSLFTFVAGRSGAGAVPSTAGEAAPIPIKVSPFVKRKLALVVGVSRFKDSRINALKYTSLDAKSVADALQQGAQFDYVKSLLDEDATRYHVQTEIDNLAKLAEPEDLVVLYLSSHGSPENLDTAGVNYIVAYDTEVNNLYATAYQMDDLIRDINDRIKAERVVAFLDTCYSGGTFRELPVGWKTTSRSVLGDSGVSASQLQEKLRSGSRALVVDLSGTVKTVDRVPQDVGRVIITSSRQAEKSWEDERIQHGYFTYFLLEALKKPGPVSVDDIYSELSARVPEAVLRDKKESQHPGIAKTKDPISIYLRDRIKSGGRDDEP